MPSSWGRQKYTGLAEGEAVVEGCGVVETGMFALVGVADDSKCGSVVFVAAARNARRLVNGGPVLGNAKMGNAVLYTLSAKQCLALGGRCEQWSLSKPENENERPFMEGMFYGCCLGRSNTKMLLVVVGWKPQLNRGRGVTTKWVRPFAPV